ncbi:MAG TPA: ATP-dependent helicase, partial [Methylophilaceae bacterium]|nr:ATP-dependent helicase [Methylophilaceae bacterium]
EKLIKREIPKEKATVPQSTTPEKSKPRARSHEHVAAERERPAAARTRPARKNTDEWFDKPYEPSAEIVVNTQPVQANSKPKGEVAALLGGLRRSEQ